MLDQCRRSRRRQMQQRRPSPPLTAAAAAVALRSAVADAAQRLPWRQRCLLLRPSQISLLQRGDRERAFDDRRSAYLRWKDKEHKRKEGRKEGKKEESCVATPCRVQVGMRPPIVVASLTALRKKKKRKRKKERDIYIRKCSAVQISATPSASRHEQIQRRLFAFFEKEKIHTYIHTYIYLSINLYMSLLFIFKAAQSPGLCPRLRAQAGS